MAGLNRLSPLPLYAQLARQVQARIAAGTYPPGTAIPSEHALCEEFDVGRPTVRQATEELTKLGMVERRRGAGTFVNPQVNAVDLFTLGGTIRSFKDRGVELTTRLLNVCQRATHEDNRAGFTFQRVGFVCGEPIVLENFWFDEHTFPDLDTLPLAGQSLSQLVQRHFGLVPLSADQVFSAVDLNRKQAELLGTRPRASALSVERSLHFSIGRSLVHVHMLCKKDARFTFTQTIGGYIA